jgi:hypothetical protein
MATYWLNASRWTVFRAVLPKVQTGKQVANAGREIKAYKKDRRG